MDRGLISATGSTFPNSGAPSALAASGLPLITGTVNDNSLADYISSNPNADTSTTDGYGDIYVLRLNTSGPGLPATTTYDAADIQVTGSTWSVVYPAPSVTATTTSLGTAPASPQVSGTSVTLTATVTPSAPGTVQFEYGTGTPTLIGTPVTVSGGTASTSTTTLPVGTDDLSAVFTPSGSGFSGSTGTASYTISSNLTPTTTVLTASPASPQLVGTPITLTATVTTSGVDGTVQFENGGSDLGAPVTTSGGVATFPTSTLPVGTDDLSAVFTPTTAGFAASTGTDTFTIQGTPTTTTLTPTPASPQFAGTSVTLTATVASSAAQGTVQFEYGSGTPTLIGTPVTVSSGSASTSTTALPVGTDDLSAVFTPASGSDFAGSTGTASYLINPVANTTTVLTASPASPQLVGTPITLTATVTTPAWKARCSSRTVGPISVLP